MKSPFRESTRRNRIESIQTEKVHKRNLGLIHTNQPKDHTGACNTHLTKLHKGNAAIYQQDEGSQMIYKL